MFFDILPANNAFEVDSKEEYLYFMAENDNQMLLLQFDIDKGKVNKAIQHQQLAVKESDWIVVGQDVVFYSAAYKDEMATGALWRYFTKHLSDKSEWFEITAYKSPLSTARVDETSFVVTVQPQIDLDNIMIFKLDFEDSLTWRLILIENVYQKLLLFKSTASAYDESNNIIFKVDHINQTMYFYAIDTDTGKFSESVKGSSLNTIVGKATSKMLLHIDNNNLYIVIEAGFFSHLIIYNTVSKEFNQISYYSFKSNDFLGFSNSMAIVSSNSNTTTDSINILPVNSINSIPSFTPINNNSECNLSLISQPKPFRTYKSMLNITSIPPPSPTPLWQYTYSHFTSLTSFNLSPCYLNISTSDFSLSHHNWSFLWGPKDVEFKVAAVNRYPIDKLFGVRNTTGAEMRFGGYVFEPQQKEVLFLLRAKLDGLYYDKPMIAHFDPLIGNWSKTMEVDGRIVWHHWFSRFIYWFNSNQCIQGNSFLSHKNKKVLAIVIVGVYFALLAAYSFKLISEAIHSKYNIFYRKLGILYLSLLIQVFGIGNEDLTIMVIWICFLMPYLTPFLFPYVIYYMYKMETAYENHYEWIRTCLMISFLYVFCLFLYHIWIKLLRPKYQFLPCLITFSSTHLVLCIIYISIFYTDSYFEQTIKFYSIGSLCICLLYLLLYSRIFFSLLLSMPKLIVFGESSPNLAYLMGELNSWVGAVGYYNWEVSKMVGVVIGFVICILWTGGGMVNVGMSIAGAAEVGEVFWLGYLVFWCPFKRGVENWFEIINTAKLVVIAGWVLTLIYLTKNGYYLDLFETTVIISMPYSYIIYLILKLITKFTKCDSKDRIDEKRHNLQCSQFVSEIHISQRRANDRQPLIKSSKILSKTYEKIRYEKINGSDSFSLPLSTHES
jgi:hypothetical protein